MRVLTGDSSRPQLQDTFTFGTMDGKMKRFSREMRGVPLQTAWFSEAQPSTTTTLQTLTDCLMRCVWSLHSALHFYEQAHQMVIYDETFLPVVSHSDQ